MRRLHPDAPMPEVFADEPMLRNADNLRSKMSDEAFLSALGREDGWGDLSGWTAERFDAARSAPVGDEERGLLVDALLRDGGNLIENITLKMVEKYSRGRGDNQLINEYPMGELTMNNKINIGKNEE